MRFLCLIIGHNWQIELHKGGTCLRCGEVFMPHFFTNRLPSGPTPATPEKAAAFTLGAL